MTIWGDEVDVEAAAASARKLSDATVTGTLVGLETVAEAEYFRRADEPTLPELVASSEVADMLGGISRQRVHQLQSVAGFPEPLFRLKTGPVWDALAVRKFAAVWTRKPGRPRKNEALTEQIEGMPADERE